MTQTMNAETPAVDLDAPIRETCGRCLGAGSVSWGNDSKGAVYDEDGSYRIVPKVCFECDGVGYTTTTQRKINRREKDRARRAAKAEAERLAGLAERDAKIAAWTAENADLVEALATLSGPFADSLREGIALGDFPGEKASETVRRIVAEQAAEPEAAPVVEGRIVVAGKIVGVKIVDGFGYNAAEVVKVTVLDDRGFRVYGTIAASLATEFFNAFYAEGREWHLDGPSVWATSIRGERVTFTATVERSERDETFGFFKRPTKASRLA